MSLDQDKNRHYSLRKLSVGLASVLIGISFVSAKGQVVKADNVKDNAKSAINEQAAKPETQDMQASILKGTSEPVKQNDENIDMAGIQGNTPPVQTSVKRENRSENSNLSLNSNDVSSLNKNMQTVQNDVPRENRAEGTQPQGKQQTSSDQNSAVKSQKNLLDNLDQQKTSAQSGDRVEDTSQTQPQNSQKLDLTKHRQRLAKKVLATNLIETNSLATTNGGFDEATWGKLDVNDWQGSVQDGVYQLTGYTGDSSHVIVPNEADFEKAGKSTNGLQVGVDRGIVRSLFYTAYFGQRTIAFSKTNNEKVKAIGTDWSNAFANAFLSKFDGSNLDVSNVTNMHHMFEGNSISDLTSLDNWNTSKVTDMMAMFDHSSISDLTPLNNWDVSNVTNMSHMFDHNSINNLTPLDNWNTNSVTNMSYMFDHNSINNLTPLDNWDVSNVTNMSHMFDHNSISDLTPLNNWDVSNVTNMALMFESNSISNLTGLDNWNTSKVTSMNSMFYNNSISNLTPLSHWDVSNVTDMRAMFENNSISNLTPLSHWDVSNVTDMRAMFENNSINNLTSLDNWDTGNVTDMREMFENNSISDLTGLDNWNTSKVTYMAFMFAENPDIIDLKPIAGWNISNVDFNNWDGDGFSTLFAGDTKLDLTNIKNDAPLIQGFLKEPNALMITIFITNNADLIKATTGKDLPALTNTAKRIIIFNLPHAEPKTITQTIYYKNTVPAVQIDWFDSEDPEIGKPYSLQDSDWYLDTSKLNDVTVNGQPSTEYKAYTLDPNGEDIDFAAIPLPKIPGYKAKISRIPSGNLAQPARFLVSFVALPSVNPGAQNTPDNTKQNQDVISDTKHLTISNMQMVSNQPVLLENADSNLQTLNTDTNTSTWQIENNVADELIAPYVVFNSSHDLHLPRFNNYNLQIIKRTSNKDNLSFVYLNQNKTFKYVFNIKIEDGKYLLSISQFENKRLIPSQEISFNDYHQLIKLIVKLISY